MQVGKQHHAQQLRAGRREGQAGVRVWVNGKGGSGFRGVQGLGFRV